MADPFAKAGPRPCFTYLFIQPASPQASSRAKGPKARRLHRDNSTVVRLHNRRGMANVARDNHRHDGDAMTLLAAATAVREMAYAPYSRFKVGAALRGVGGKVYVGCNVENAAYPEGTCAEAGAIAAMIAGGETRIAELLVIADCPRPVPPCGGCRQKIAEFADPAVVVTLATTDGLVTSMTVADLLPGGFTAADMDRD
jgi:cytidine deaminase